MIGLGDIFEFGRGTPKNSKRAAKLFFDATKGGATFLATATGRTWDRATARELQRLLKQAGYYDGGIDGSVGPGTRRALQALADAAS